MIRIQYLPGGLLMRKYLTAVFACVFMAPAVYGAAEFVCTVMQSGGDYTSLTNWNTGVACDIAHSTGTRVFSCAKTGTVSDGATVFGNGCAAATGTVCHVTATQVMIKNIRGGDDAFANVI